MVCFVGWGAVVEEDDDMSLVDLHDGPHDIHSEGEHNHNNNPLDNYDHVRSEHESNDEEGDHDTLVEDVEEEEDEEDEQFEWPNVDDYATILNHLSEQWMITEADHKVSQAASNAFWKLSLSWFHRLLEAKKEQNIRKKTPQFIQIRNKIYDNKLPPIKLELGYKHKESNELIVVNDIDAAPVGSFPPSDFLKLYEVASVPTEALIDTHERRCQNFDGKREIDMSLDGVSESKSSTVSLDVYTTRFRNCRVIYPNRVVRPLGRFKVNNLEHLKHVLDDYEKNYCLLKKFIGDNPKRSFVKSTLSHSSNFPCEYCFAKGQRAKTTHASDIMKHESTVIKKQKAEYKRQIELLKSTEGTSTSSDDVDKQIELLNKIIGELDTYDFSTANSKRSHIVWPASTRLAPVRSVDEIRNILERIESNESLTPDELKGVISRSLFFDIPNFDFVNDIPAEYMHSCCLGVTRRLLECTFSVGEQRTRITTRKLTSAFEFNKNMKNIKVYCILKLHTKFHFISEHTITKRKKNKGKHM